MFLLIFISLLGASIGCFFNAFIVQFLTKIILKFKPDYWNVYKASVAAYFLAFIIGYTMASGAQRVGLQLPDLTFIWIIVGLLSGAFVYGVIVDNPGAGNIGFKHGLLINVAQYVLIFIVIFLTVFLSSFFKIGVDW